MALFFVSVSAIFWIITYIEAIRIGFKEKTYAIPFFALALNFAWEVVDSVWGYIEYGFHIQVIYNIIGAFLDTFIVITFFLYGYKYFAHILSKKHFLVWAVFIFAISFPIQYAFIAEFGLLNGPLYAAYIQNLIMSILFIGMFYQRQGLEGQSLLLAVSKFIGTLAATSHFIVNRYVFFVVVFGTIVVIFDVIYIILLHQERRRQNLSSDNIKPTGI